MLPVSHRYRDQQIRMAPLIAEKGKRRLAYPLLGDGRHRAQGGEKLLDLFALEASFDHIEFHKRVVHGHRSGLSAARAASHPGNAFTYANRLDLPAKPEKRMIPC